ncbi:MAG: transporter substrate-binding domain-containing protein [Verrucomicrobiota bacterium JB022]|nr:transporter substrate-binding domain-containing protein [Verrucomicrobiota bacterium JB022]
MSSIWRPRTILIGMVGLSVLMTGCERFPRDPAGTLERVEKRGVLRAGAFENPPWVTVEPDGTVTGVEVALIEDFARELGVSVEWSHEGAEDLFASLEKHELDVVIGGITQQNPWRTQLGFSLPFATIHPGDGEEPKRQVMAVASGENAMLMRLEAFLLSRRDEVEALQVEDAP